jgi:L-lactate dehydrogenase complex protein LldG
MASVDQQAFLDNLRRALTGNTGNGTASTGDPLKLHAGIYQPLTQIESRTREESLSLLDQVIQESGPINLKVTACEDIQSAAQDIRRLAIKRDPEWGDKKQIAAWKHPLVMALNLPEVLKDVGIPVGILEQKYPGDREKQRQWIFDAYIGITSADFCLAQSATLVLKTRAGQDRSVSLVPSIHVAVIRLEQILGSLKELYYILDNDPEHLEEGLTPCLTFITGPSKTADIEATMVHGAHGPREVHLFVVTGL